MIITLYVDINKNSKNMSWIMNITLPNKTSEVYKQYVGMIQQKIQAAVIWLTERNIEYINNIYVDNHLYRLYIPCKDLLLDFEWFPAINPNYHYVRVDFLTNIEDVLERLFPETIIDTQHLNVWKLNQLPTNKFLRQNNHSPVYDKDVLRLALLGDNQMIYQCIVIKDNKIIANATQQNCSVPYGTLILLRYLNEMFGYDEILVKDNYDDSYKTTMYQLLNLPIVSKTCKKRIWWSANKTKWRISPEERAEYIPFYFTEDVIYKYPSRI